MTSPMNDNPSSSAFVGVDANRQDTPALPIGHPERQRAFEAARYAASSISRWAHTGYQITPEVIERYRWLIVAMATARGTPGAMALADLARRAYVFDGTAVMPSVREIDRGAVIRSSGLPRRRFLQFSIMELYVAKVNVSAYATLSIVSAHATIRIKADLRSEGHDLG